MDIFLHTWKLRHASVSRPRRDEIEREGAQRDRAEPVEDADLVGPNEPMLPRNTIEEPEPEECEARCSWMNTENSHTLPATSKSRLQMNMLVSQLLHLKHISSKKCGMLSAIFSTL